jgi:hypothetical protein
MRFGWLGLFVGLLILSACSRPAGVPPQGAGTKNGPEIKRRELAALPPVGDFLPPVDDGRLQAAAPLDWNVLPRGKTYVMGFAKGKASELPRIVIAASDAPAGSPPTLAADSAAAFVTLMDNSLRTSAKSGARTVNEFNLPLVLGDTTFVRHVRQAVLGDMPCVIQSLQTVQGGRLYAVELIAEIEAARAEDYEKSLTKWRDAAYTVAAHLKFAAPGEKLETTPEVPSAKEP